MKSTGVKVVFDQISDTWAVHVPAKFSGKTEGLCGLADGEISNDLWIGTYAVASVSAGASVSADVVGSFFNHWLANSHGLAAIDASCLTDATSGTGLIAGGGNALARTFCSKLFTGDAFTQLAGLVDTNEYIDTCVRATASLPIPHADAIVSSDWPGCSVFAAYAEAGARLGKCVDWRSSTFCAYSGCTGNCAYQACGPSIQKTCDNFKIYDSLSVTYNSEGCFCAEGKVSSYYSYTELKLLYKQKYLTPKIYLKNTKQ